MAQKSEPIRLQRSLLEEVQKLAQEEGTSVSEFVNVAVAERVGALRTARFFAERAARADVASAIELLRHLGAANEPLPGDEIGDPAADDDLALAGSAGRDRRR